MRRRRVSGANLEVEHFGLPNSRAKHRNGSKSWFGAETGEGRLPFPLPLIRRQPLSPARRRTAPLTQGSHKAAAAANGEETIGRCGVRRPRSG